MIPSFDIAAPAPAPHGLSCSTPSNMLKAQPVQTNTLEKEGGNSLRGTKGKQVIRPVVELTPRPPTKGKAVPQTGTGSKKASSELVKAGSGPSNHSRLIVGVESDEEVQSDDEVESDDEMQGGVDLSGETYVEGSRLDSIKVPEAEHQACGF
jgi:hypothetical protein